MQVTVYGQNYTGSHFRSIEDMANSISVRLLLTGNEQAIVNYIREHFSYGVDEGDNITTLAELATEYKNGNEPIFDGCGGVFLVTHQGTPIIDNTDQFLPPDDEGNDEQINNHRWLDVSVDVDQEFPLNLNALVKRTITNNTRPKQKK